MLGRDVVADELDAADVHARVNHRVRSAGRRLHAVREVAHPHQHRDLAAQVLLVEAKRCFAVAAEIKLGEQSHLPRLTTTITTPGTTSTMSMMAAASRRWRRSHA